MSDLDVLKEIPGYKAILKSVLKSQIQLLMEQLSEHTGEESIILTASVNDGSLSHLGSNTGKGFLEGRDEIKSQFLGYCLKTYHKQKTHEPQKPYQRTHPSPRSPAQMLTPPAKRPRVQPVSLSRASPAQSYPNQRMPLISQKRFPSDTGDSRIGLGSGASLDSVTVKTEQVDKLRTDTTETEPELSEPSFTTASGSIPESVHLSHTQTSVDSSETGVEMDLTLESKQEIGVTETEKAGSSDMTSIKIEQVEDEFEITGVEMAAGALDNWGQDQSGYGIIEGDGSFDQSADQSGYSFAQAETFTDQADGVVTIVLPISLPEASQVPTPMSEQMSWSLGGFSLDKNIWDSLPDTAPVTNMCADTFDKSNIDVKVGDFPNKLVVCDKASSSIVQDNVGNNLACNTDCTSSLTGINDIASDHSCLSDDVNKKTGCNNNINNFIVLDDNINCSAHDNDITNLILGDNTSGWTGSNELPSKLTCDDSGNLINISNFMYMHHIADSDYQEMDILDNSTTASIELDIDEASNITGTTIEATVSNTEADSFDLGCSEADDLADSQSTADGMHVLRCLICFKDFHTKQSLLRHNTIHTGEKFKCGVCTKTFSRRYYLKDHLKLRHEISKNKAAQYIIECRETDLNKSLSLFETLKPSSTRMLELSKQTSNLASEKVFSCALCNREFRHEGHVTDHIESIHKKSKCDVEKYVVDKYVNAHLESIHKKLKNDAGLYVDDERGSVCMNEPYCEEKNVIQLNDDLESIHKKYMSDVGKNVADKRKYVTKKRLHCKKTLFICKLCNGNFSTRSHLKRHVERVHKKSKNKLLLYMLEVDNRKSSVELDNRKSSVELDNRKSSVELDKRKSSVELDNRKSSVELNNRKSSVELDNRKSSVELNNRKSSVELDNKCPSVVIKLPIKAKRIHCSMCKEMFNQKYRLVDHMVQVHRKSKFESHQVVRRMNFKRLRNAYKPNERKVHAYKSSTKEKSYKCSVCERLFTRNCHLKDHLINVHKITKEDTQQYMIDLRKRDTHNLTEKDIVDVSNHGIRLPYVSVKRTLAEKSVKPYKCSFCDKGFGKKRNLKEHLVWVHMKAWSETEQYVIDCRFMQRPNVEDT